MFSERQKSALREASRDRLTFGAKVQRVLTVAGRDRSRFIAGRCGYRGEDGLAWILEATLSIPLSRDLEGEEVRLDWLVGGEVFRGFSGKAVIVKTDGVYTELTAATEGYEAERTPLGKGPAHDREIAGASPSTTLYDALEMLGYRGYDIPYFEEPKINRRGAEKVRWTGKVSDLTAIVEDEGELLPRDRSDNIASAYRTGPIEGEPAWTFEERVDTDAGGITEETADDERYFAVQLYRANEGGGHEPATEPIEIDNRGRKVNPASVLLEEFTADAEAAGESAYRKAHRMALERGRSDSQTTIECVYPPFFLQRGGLVLALSSELSVEEERVSTYLVRADSVSVDTEALRGTVSGESERVGVESFPRERGTFESVPGFVRPLMGFDTDGQIYFDSSLPWVSEDADHVVLDVGIAARHGVTITEEPEIVQVVS